MVKNALLATVSFALTWLLLELLIFPLALPWLPLRIHAALPRALRPLAGSSKAGTLSAHYVALLGDSYAQGAGDWLLDVDPLANAPFHSAHLLRERSGRDVISLGASGAGSLRAMGTEPPAIVDYLKRTWRYRLADPEVLLVYFYEGNDLQDNLRDLDHTFFSRGFDPAQIYDGAYFRAFVRQTAAQRTPVAEELASWHWTDNFFLARFVARVLRATVERSWERGGSPLDWSPGQVNQARIGGVDVALPDGLQAPPLELTHEQLELAIWANAQGFALLRERFPRARTIVVYLPSPLASYRVSSPEVDVQVQHGAGPWRFSRDALAERSDYVCRRIAEVTRAGDGEFLDARPALWELAARRPIHGPRDWRHFNRIGQERLVDAILPVLDAGGQVECASLRALLAAG